MTAPTDIAQVWADMKRARAWALRHFNTDIGHSGLLDPPAFDVQFEADRMTVYSVLYGQRIIGVCYRLKWLAGQVGWEAYSPLTNKPVSWLRVLDEEVTK